MFSGRLDTLILFIGVSLAFQTSAAFGAGPSASIAATKVRETSASRSQSSDASNGLPARLAALEKQVANLQSQVATLQQNKALLLDPYVTVDQNSENGLNGPNIVFSGANIHIVDGSGATDDNGGAPLGLGNLVIGYDENASSLPRTGSHNLAVGANNGFSSVGGFVAGRFNLISGNFATVSAGIANTASGGGASVSGGSGNTASANVSSVSGGSGNTAAGPAANVSGGGSNFAGGFHANISGGVNNNSSGDFSSILGGNGIALSTADDTSPLTQ